MVLQKWLMAGATALGVAATALGSSFSDSKGAILSMGGCFLVDYSYSETEALQKGYTLDPRVYDVNRDKSVKELILPQELSPTKIRLQHVLFFSDLSGKVAADSLMKHHAEDWEFEPDSLYEFTSPSHWMPVPQVKGNGQWVRRITNLDDGLRYQCSASWDLAGEYPQWTCGNNYAPIPGRETRDMGRKDYNTLDRNTRLILYGDNWLERQDNTKTLHSAQGRTPLAKEVGKNWYARLPESQCAEAKAWAEPRQAFWDLLRDTWDGVLTGQTEFVEKAVPGQPPRFVKMMAVESKYAAQVEKDPAVAAQARKDILTIIQEYRAP